MKLPNNRTPFGTLIMNILSWPGRFIAKIGWNVFKVNRCTIDGQGITLHKGIFTSRTVLASEIETWSFSSEMGVDIVSIHLTSGEVLIWVDKYNDLLMGLRMLVGDKQTPAE